MDLNELFHTKRRLEFNENGAFRILMVSDMHYAPEGDNRTIHALELLLDTQKPDFVMLGGDNTTGKSEKSQFESLLSDIARPMETRGIPWAHVFGNHDISEGISKEYQQQKYEAYPHCISKKGDESLPGVGNYFLPIYDMDGDVKYGIWALDSHQDFATPSVPLNYKGDVYWDLLMPKRLNAPSDWEFVRFEQIMWYYTTSSEIERSLGRKLPALMFLHIPLVEFNALLMNANRTRTVGEFNESVCASEINSGLFAAALQRGDIQGIFAGHDHVNTFDGTYMGIRMGYDGSLGYQAYGCSTHDLGGDKHRLRGGRIIDLNLSDTAKMETRMVFINELAKIEGGKEV